MPKDRRRITANGEVKRYSHIVWHAHTGHWPEWPEVIHHKDFDKFNDAFENLQLMSDSEHKSMHSSGDKNPMHGKTGENSPSWKGNDATLHSKYCRIRQARKREET